MKAVLAREDTVRPRPHDCSVFPARGLGFLVGVQVVNDGRVTTH